jgi:hypothetical protein
MVHKDGIRTVCLHNAFDLPFVYIQILFQCFFDDIGFGDKGTPLTFKLQE